MRLGFASAILPELTLNEVLQVAQDIGYQCVEVMCWPVGKSSRRYAGVTHIDLDLYNDSLKSQIQNSIKESGVHISALGYYPNPLVNDKESSKLYINHILRLIEVASDLGLEVVNTFVGRDHEKSVDENWPRFMEIWQLIIEKAERYKVKIGIENCPMIFTNDEWPGGKNLATTPVIWDKMFDDISSDYFGLNYDPSHMIWQHMDYLNPIKNYHQKFFHVHAKDVRIDQEELDRYGIMSPPNLWHTPKLPGMGDVNWGKFFSHLTDVGYKGDVCVEVEDRSYEKTLESRKASLVHSYNYLKQFFPIQS